MLIGKHVAELDLQHSNFQTCRLWWANRKPGITGPGFTGHKCKGVGSNGPSKLGMRSRFNASQCAHVYAMPLACLNIEHGDHWYHCWSKTTNAYVNFFFYTSVAHGIKSHSSLGTYPFDCTPPLHRRTRNMAIVTPAGTEHHEAGLYITQ